MNILTLIMVILYLIGATTCAIAGFLVAIPLGFVAITVFTVAASVVLYKELGEGE